MPHLGEEVEEAVEAAREIVEQVDNADTDPPPGTPSKREKMRSTISLMTHVVALMAATGAFFKTCDHSVTKSAYDALSADIQKLSDQDQKNHDDLVAIHGYLDGLSRNPLTPIATLADAGVPLSTKPHPKPPVTLPVVTSTTAIAAETREGDIMAIIAENVPPVPVLHPAPAPVKPLSFDKAVESK
jgi:hypothetical protein